MTRIPALPGISSQLVETPRLRTHVLSSGPAEGVPVLFVHGNVSSATFWEETMLALPSGYRAITPDLRGYGDSEFKPLDATRGMADFADDLLALLDTLGVEEFHAAGHSMGGAVLYTLTPLAGSRLRSLTLVAPASPYGFGGSSDLDGRPIYPDFAASGAGLGNPDFVKRLAAGDRSEESPTSPRNVMNGHYWKPPFRAAREEELLSSMLATRTGAEHYPGDLTTSANWPGVAPGTFGPLNAMSPKYVGESVERFVGASHKPAILWVRGADDFILGDNSFYDLAVLGGAGLVPGYPGAQTHPVQPMIGQTRAVLEQYAANGGSFRELVFENCGHTPFLERPDEFNAAFHELLAAS
jgi:pimeloyl-ACP methyl ester carboxylesterase